VSRIALDSMMVFYAGSDQREDPDRAFVCAMIPTVRDDPE
jgi:hypothetical protein